LESYTSVGISKKYLQEISGKEIESKPRSFFEGKSQLIIKEAKSKNVALLIQGDCLSATTHISLLQEASDKGVVIEVIHGISIFTAISETGLSLYNFGKTASITFENENVKTFKLGTKERKIKFGKIKDLLSINLKDYPQCIIIIGNTHFVEEDYLNKFKV